MRLPGLVWAPAFIMNWAVLAAAQSTTIAVKTEEVRVDVLVTDHGRPVHGLKAEEFTVLDNGVPQRISFASQEHIPFNAVLVLDMSSSVAGERLSHLRRAGRVLLDEFERDESAALVTFSHAVSIKSALTNDIEAVKAELDGVQPMGDTAVIDASYTGLILSESRPGRPLLIIFSDGLDTSSWLTADAALETAKCSDAVVYAVSSGKHPKMTFLQDLTQTTGGTLFKIESTRNLGQVFMDILEEFRRRYLLTYSPAGALSRGWHKLDVRVRDSRLTVKARPGFLIR